MAVSGTAKQIAGFADVFGGKNFNAVDYSGSKSYNNTGVQATSGDLLDPKAFGFFNDIISIIGDGIDQTGTYQVTGQTINGGVTQWRLRWFVVSTGAEVANGVNLSGFTVRVSAIGS